MVSCIWCVWLLIVSGAGLGAQPSPDRAAAEALSRRVAARTRALQQEAERLAGEAKTLVGDLRRFEIARDIAIARVAETGANVAAAERDLEALSRRLAALEKTRVESLPDLSARFVELYKRGQGSYVRMLAGVRDPREFGRATRAVASLAHINQVRIGDHRRTLDALRAERTAVEQKSRDLQVMRAEAQKARAASERAVNVRAALVTQIDSRRDLNAQLAGELLVAQQKLQEAIAAMGTGQTVDAVAVPITPFRGALEWPVVGRVVGQFGRSNRGEAAGVRNGIEIAVPEGTPVQAVHPGTIGFADSFTGYGTLVIVDHGGNHFSLYGYLSSVAVERGQRVEAGHELGRAGLAPAGDGALYFEVRIDGRSTNPLEWLKKR